MRAAFSTLLISAALTVSACNGQKGWGADPYDAWQQGYHAGLKAAQEDQQRRRAAAAPVQPTTGQQAIYSQQPPPVPEDPYRNYGYEGGGTPRQMWGTFYGDE